ncbi:MAG: hypothetical protein K2J80_07410 [Oscillospiraceae bacterium]|nr:hypothetical protein [Oscillospiraceae bacterium]
MTIYIERESGIITPGEWLEYVNADSELILSENGTAINPITKAPMRFKIFGRTLWKDYEITYKDGRIGSEDSSAELIDKLTEIAAALSAEVFDCGEKIR